MQQRFVVLFLFLFAVPSWGAEPVAGGTTAKEPAKIKLSYTITNDTAKSEAIIEGEVGARSEDMAKWMSDLIVPKLRKLPTVSSLQFIAGEPVKNEFYESYTWSSYVPYDRKSHILVQFNFQSPVSMLFDVNETKRVCKASVDPGAGQVDGDQDTPKFFEEDDHEPVTAATPCEMSTQMTITGPIAVYGTFAGPVNSTLVLHNQINLSWSLGSGYNLTNTQLVGTLLARNPNFQTALLKMLEFARFKPVFAEQFATDPIRPTMKQAARVIRSINEEILKGQ